MMDIFFFACYNENKLQVVDCNTRQEKYIKSVYTDFKIYAALCQISGDVLSYWSL